MFAFLPILAKVALGADTPVTTMLAYRFLIAAVFLWVLRGLAPAGRVGSYPALVGLGIAFVFTSLFMFLALTKVPAAFASLVFYTYPALVTVASVVLFGTRPTATRIALVVLALTGCLLMFRPQGHVGALLSGGALALGSATAYTAYILLGHATRKQTPPIVTASYVAAINAVVFAATAAYRGELIVHLPARAWLAMLGIGVFSTGLALVAFLAGMARIGPSAAALVSTVEPLITVCLAFVLLGERLSTVEYAGGVMIVVAVAGLRLDRTAPEGSRPRPRFEEGLVRQAEEAGAEVTVAGSAVSRPPVR